MIDIDKSMQDDLIAFRRDLHQHPEIGYKEYRTSQLIADSLSAAGIPPQKSFAGAATAVIAEIRKGEGPVIALRADIDALPIHENTSLPFASINDNIMHACGHDVHTTMLLGAGLMLRDLPFNGCIRLIFQPSEEGNYDDPERKSGGQRLVDGGVLYNVDAALGLHVHPLLPVGKIAYALDTALACVNFFSITITGKAGHAGAAPHLAVDAVVIAANVIQNVQTIVSRNISPTEPAVLSITTISGGGKENIIADKVVMKGTIRALSKETYDDLIQRLKQMLAGIATTFDARIDLDISLEYPSLINHKEIHSLLEQPLSDTFGKENVVMIPPMMGGEDFAFYSRTVPSMFYFLGAMDTAPEVFFVHHPSVVINEDCISYGAKFLAAGALTLLKQI